MAKGPDAFRTISEAADELNVPQHVLRFWETKFSFIRPMKRAGGRRFYRRQDIEILRCLRILLHDQGYTIKGVQRLHKEQGVKRLMTTAEEAPANLVAAPILNIEGIVLETKDRERLGLVLRDLEAAKARLDALLKRR